MVTIGIEVHPPPGILSAPPPPLTMPGYGAGRDPHDSCPYRRKPQIPITLDRLYSRGHVITA